MNRIIGLITFLVFIITSVGFSQKEKINWMTWDEMISMKEKETTPKKIFVDLYTPWCGWCKKMDATTFIDPSVIAYMNKNFYAVKFDAESRDTILFNNRTFTNSAPEYVKPSPNARGKTHWFAYSLLEGKMAYPSYAILDEEYNRVVIYNGAKSVDEMVGILSFFGTDQYKYYHNFLNQQWQKSIPPTE